MRHRVLVATGLAVLLSCVCAFDAPPRVRFLRDVRPTAVVSSGESGELRAHGRRVLLADFEARGAVALGGSELGFVYPELFAEVVAALLPSTGVIVLCSSEDEAAELGEILNEHDKTAEAVLFAVAPHDTMWIRDYGALFARDSECGTMILDTVYPDSDRARDDDVPARLGRLLGLPVRKVDLKLDGGNLVLGGDGLCVTTTKLFEENAELDHEEVARRLAEHCGCETLVVLEPLAGEPSGHADMFVSVPTRGTVLVGQYDEEDDPVNARILARNAERLRQVRHRGESLHVVKIPMPPHKDDVWRTYTNLTIAGRSVLLPSYGPIDETGRQCVRRLLRRWLPEHRVVEIDVEATVQMGGALHCFTLNLPVVDALVLARAKVAAER